jgi:hypothetical protein
MFWIAECCEQRSQWFRRWPFPINCRFYFARLNWWCWASTAILIIIFFAVGRYPQLTKVTTRVIMLITDFMSSTFWTPLEFLNCRQNCGPRNSKASREFWCPNTFLKSQSCQLRNVETLPFPKNLEFFLNREPWWFAYSRASPTNFFKLSKSLNKKFWKLNLPPVAPCARCSFPLPRLLRNISCRGK